MPPWTTQNLKDKTNTLPFADPGFTAVPYSQTNECRPPILIVPPRNPLRSSKTASQAIIPSETKKSFSSASGDAEYSIAGLHSSYSPCRNQKYAIPEAECWEDVFRFSGYGDELYEFGEMSKSTESGIDDKSFGMQCDEESDDSMDKSLSPEPLKLRRPKPQRKSIVSVAGSVMSGNTKQKRTFWFQKRKSHRPANTPGTKVECLQPLSSVHSEKSKQMFVAETDSSGCSMHTPTSVDCPDLDDRLLSFQECLALEEAEVAASVPKRMRISKSGSSTNKKPSFANVTNIADLVSELSIGGQNGPSKPLPPGELPHTLAVVIPDGKLFGDDFLDLLSF